MFGGVTTIALTWARLSASWLCLVIAVVGGLYFFWKKAQEEHFDLIPAFDAISVASFFGVVASRLSYVFLHPDQFGFQPAGWVNFFAFPGLWAPAGLVVFFWIMARWANTSKLEAWEVWDVSSIFLAWYFGWYWVSRFLLGAAAGTPTNLPWGIVFPLRVEAAHPVQLYGAAFFFALFLFLWWAEPKYRFFLWYRSKKRTAKSGFLFAFFVMIFGLQGFVLSFTQYPFLLIWDIDLNQIISALLFFLGCGLLYVRSGRTFFLLKSKKERAV